MNRHAAATSESSMTPPATKSREMSKDSAPLRGSRTGLGNAATAGLLAQGNSAKEIPPSIRARMESSFGIDARDIRIDDSSAAREESDSLNAEAFVQHGQIHWGSCAPPLDSPQAESLLAHEIAHVKQHRHSGADDDRVSSPQEAAEQSADAAAGQASAGNNAAGQTAIAAGAAPAGVARQSKPGAAPATSNSTPSATHTVAAFLQKVARTAPPQNIKKARVVRDALRKLAWSAGSSARLLDVDKFAQSETTSNDPNVMAEQFVARVPRINPAALRELDNQPFIDQQSGLVGRISDLLDKSAPRGGEFPLPPGQISTGDQAQNTTDILGAMRGTRAPGGFGPVKGDILQLGRIAQGAGGVLKSKETKPPGVQADDYPAVESAIAKMPKDALVPAEVKGKGNTDDWAATSDFALDLARSMDFAQRSKQSECIVTLGSNYEGIKDREALRIAVEAIIQQLRDALPHHATDVKYVIVKTGRTTLTRGIVQAP
ncbi:MAG: DUF4157 domain-containing protein [Terracidiphilus sp.]